jgi:hypothetical protein
MDWIWMRSDGFGHLKVTCIIIIVVVVPRGKNKN